MKKIRKVAAAVLVVAAMMLAQSAVSAAPLRGMAMATEHSANDSLFGRFLALFGAIWGGDGSAVWGGNGPGGGGNGAVWGGGGGGGGNNSAVWGGNGAGGGGN
jgi:hypothetical protein